LIEVQAKALSTQTAICSQKMNAPYLFRSIRYFPRCNANTPSVPNKPRIRADGHHQHVLWYLHFSYIFNILTESTVCLASSVALSKLVPAENTVHYENFHKRHTAVQEIHSVIGFSYYTSPSSSSRFKAHPA